MTRVKTTVILLLFASLGWACPAAGQGPGLALHFEGSGIAFDYPQDWAPDQEMLARQQRLATPGEEVLALVKAPEGKGYFQVVRRSPSHSHPSFDALYRSNKRLADTTTKMAAKGIYGARYVGLTAAVVDLPNGQKAVLSTGKLGGDRLELSYIFLSGGREYHLEFFYGDKSRAARDEDLRRQILASFKILTSP